MIVPRIDDAVWLIRFRDVPRMEPSHGPVLVVAPHPDDETLGAGLLIASLRARGVPVWVVAATDGENAYAIPQDEREALGRLREREQAAALLRLGVEAGAILRLRLTDSGLHRTEDALTDGLMDVARRMLQEHGAVTLIAPWSGDFHPDHEACARAAAAVARELGLPLIDYFFWTWHRGTPELLDGLPLVRFDGEGAAVRAKAEAMEQHASQTEAECGEPVLSERLLAPARWGFEVFVQR